MYIGRGANKSQRKPISGFFSLMFYVYILFSASHNKYYVGHTDDITRRLQEHNNAIKNSYTAKYRPWILMANFEIGPERGLARKVENHIKKQKSKQYIIDIIERNSIIEIISRLSSNG